MKYWNDQKPKNMTRKIKKKIYKILKNKKKGGRLTMDFSYTRHLDKNDLKKLETIRQKGVFSKG